MTTDADYTFLGLEALQAAEEDFGAETTYSESVAVPDAERVLRSTWPTGTTVVWTHGSQFYDATVKVAAESPDVTFIAEQDTEPADVPENVWVLDRNFHLAFYPLGVLAVGGQPERADRLPRRRHAAVLLLRGPRGRAGPGRQRLRRDAQPGVDR